MRDLIYSIIFQAIDDLYWTTGLEPGQRSYEMFRMRSWIMNQLFEDD
ncbi:MAG: hypothetical protein WC763_06925 [Candidatus Paceibacterota bacterium]